MRRILRAQHGVRRLKKHQWVTVPTRHCVMLSFDLKFQDVNILGVVLQSALVEVAVRLVAEFFPCCRAKDKTFAR